MEQLTSSVSDLALGKLMEYLSNLDWSYILTLIIFSYFASKNEVLTKTKLGKVKWIGRLRPILLSVPVAWRVFLIGLCYGAFLYWVRSYQGKDWIENLFQSLIFSMVAHKLLLQKWLDKLDNKIFPGDKTNG